MTIRLTDSHNLVPQPGSSRQEVIPQRLWYWLEICYLHTVSKKYFRSTEKLALKNIFETKCFVLQKYPKVWFRSHLMGGEDETWVGSRSPRKCRLFWPWGGRDYSVPAKWPNQSSVLLFKATDKFFYLPHTTMQTSQEQTFTKKVSSGVLSLYWALMGNTALSILKENCVQQWNFIL